MYGLFRQGSEFETGRSTRASFFTNSPSKYYSYYYNAGTYEIPPEEDMEIESVYLNEMDITDFFWEFVEDKVYQQVIEYARENN